MEPLSADLYAVLCVAAFVLGVVALMVARGRSWVAWSATVLAFAVGWNALAAT